MKGLKILCAGGGTAGSMIPLAVLCQWREKVLGQGERDDIVWVGTGNGLEKIYHPSSVTKAFSISSAKLHRYRDWRNIALPFQFIRAVVQAIRICRNVRPDVIWTAGGFVAVPVALAGWLLGIPILTIQQDVERGIANTLMEPLATKRAVTIPPSKQPSSSYQAHEWIGVLTRFSLFEQRKEAASLAGRPLILILGGSSGARSLNELVWDTLPLLGRAFDIVHSVGMCSRVPSSFPSWYKPFPMINGKELGRWYAASTIVIARAGMNTAAECATFFKPLVTIPLAHTHQEANARWLASNGAAIVVSGSIRPQEFCSQIVQLINDPARLRSLGQTLHALLPEATEHSITSVIRW